MKVAWFKGDAQVPEDIHWQDYRSQDEIMAWAVSGDTRTPMLRVLLVPDDTDLTTLNGDDWNDAPANANASEPYDYPQCSAWIELRIGDSWPA